MKKITTIATLTLSLAGCYLPQNFDNQLQISRTGQYQLDVTTDVMNGQMMMAKNESEQKKKPISAQDLKDVLANCETEFNKLVAFDIKNGKHIVSSKYLGECRGQLTLKYTGNIITEKKFEASIGDHDDKTSGFFIPVEMKYDAKTKQILITSKTHGREKDYGKFEFNGKLSVKTDAKVISTNADSKPYWGILGSYKWNIKDFNTPNGTMVLSTTGI